MACFEGLGTGLSGKELPSLRAITDRHWPLENEGGTCQSLVAAHGVPEFSGRRRVDVGKASQ